MPIAKAWADDDKDNILKQLLAFALVRTDFETMLLPLGQSKTLSQLSKLHSLFIAIMITFQD